MLLGHEDLASHTSGDRVGQIDLHLTSPSDFVCTLEAQVGGSDLVVLHLSDESFAVLLLELRSHLDDVHVNPDTRDEEDLANIHLDQCGGFGPLGGPTTPSPHGLG